VPAPFVHEFRVRFRECDPQGIVFNANYVAYFDDGFTELWRQAFGSYEAMVEGGIDMVVAALDVDFRAPARFDEELQMSVSIERLGSTSMTSRLRLERAGEMLVEAGIRHVFVDPGSWAKTEMPDWVREGLQPYLAAGGDAPTAGELKAMIREIPDFPRPGIVFRDATPLLADAGALAAAVELLTTQLEDCGPVDLVVGAEARGFILGPALARRLGAGFAPARRPGKLPSGTESVDYQLEYGVDALQMHSDAIEAGARVVVHDDLIATGGTAAAIAGLVEKLGGEVVAFSFLIELGSLGGRERLGAPVHSVIVFED
jgi:adenine phosphoribosyltransferase